jgi:hypothetical protein
MIKVYPSKIGPELVGPVVLVLGIVFWLMMQEKPFWPGMVILLPVTVFILQMFLTTRYAIEGHMLTIRSGFLYNKSIDIRTIHKIKTTSSIQSAPAVSMDRIEITYGKRAHIIISPKDRDVFIANILAVNEDITINLQ